MTYDKDAKPCHEPKKDDDNESSSELDSMTVIKPRENNQESSLLEKDLDDSRQREKDCPPPKDDQ
jgi:hypothetical protein